MWFAVCGKCTAISQQEWALAWTQPCSLLMLALPDSMFTNVTSRSIGNDISVLGLCQHSPQFATVFPLVVPWSSPWNYSSSPDDRVHSFLGANGSCGLCGILSLLISSPCATSVQPKCSPKSPGMSQEGVGNLSWWCLLLWLTIGGLWPILWMENNASRATNLIDLLRHRIIWLLGWQRWR